MGAICMLLKIHIIYKLYIQCTASGYVNCSDESLGRCEVFWVLLLFLCSFSILLPSARFLKLFMRHMQAFYLGQNSCAGSPWGVQGHAFAHHKPLALKINREWGTLQCTLSWKSSFCSFKQARIKGISNSVLRTRISY